MPAVVWSSLPRALSPVPTPAGNTSKRKPSSGTKVRRGETLTSIARRYGTTVREIRRLNNCGKRVATGKRLKIKTVVRHYKEDEPTPAPTGTTPSAESSMLADSGSQACDSASVEAAAADSTAAAYVAAALPPQTARVRQKTVPATAATQSTQPSQTEQKPPAAQPRPADSATVSGSTTAPAHNTPQGETGESLSKIARRYGTTVRAIQRQQSHQHQSPDWPAAYNPTVTSNPNTIAL